MWCVHVIGLGEVYAALDIVTAARWAAALNDAGKIANQDVSADDMDGLTLSQRLDKEEAEFTEAVRNAGDPDGPGLMPGDVEGMFHRIRDAAGLNAPSKRARLNPEGSRT